MENLLNKISNTLLMNKPLTLSELLDVFELFMKLNPNAKEFFENMPDRSYRIVYLNQLIKIYREKNYKSPLEIQKFILNFN
jgi:hypothetical protein